jgi:hypothetical protein
VSDTLYRTAPGQSTCVVGDPFAGSRRVPVRLASGAGAFLDPVESLRPREFVYTSLLFEDGPSLSLSGVVVRSGSQGLLIRWEHASPRDAEKAERTIRQHLEKKGKLETESMELDPAAAGRARTAAAVDRIDVGASIRGKAKRVRAADLASRLHTVHVLDMSTIKALIRDAVDESLEFLGESLAEAERHRLLEEVEESFRDRFASEKAGLEETVKLLQKQLETAQAVLEGERLRVLSAQQFTVSDAGILELEKRFSRLLDMALAKGRVDPDLEKDLRGVVARLLDDERQKIFEKAQEAQSDKIALLEKKVQRLAQSLGSAEKERDSAQRRAQALEAAGGMPLAQLYTAGLGDADPDRERKLSLLKEIVTMNRDLRRELEATGRLPPRKAPAAEKAPAEGSAAAPAAGEAPPPADEEETARSLGIRRAEPPGARQARSAAVAEAETDTVEIPVLASGPEANPDDQAWEPSAGALDKGQTRAKVKRLKKR